MPRRLFSIFPTYAVEYSVADPWERSQVNLKAPPVRTGTRGMSKESRKELINAINWMKLFSPMQTTICKDTKRRVQFRMNFITLTLSDDQVHPDSYIKEHLLEPFLKWMIRQGAKCYAWKAEAQVNGRIHFHITSNTYIYWKRIRAKWNDIQYKNGYLKSYFDKYGHHDPNSTDVHAVRDDSQLGIYIAREFGKADNWCTKKGERMPAHLINHPSRFIDSQLKLGRDVPMIKRQIEGRKWAVSNNLAGLRCFIDMELPESYKASAEFISAQDYRSIETDFAKLWFYPHIVESHAPQVVIDKLLRMKEAVKAYEEPASPVKKKKSS